MKEEQIYFDSGEKRIEGLLGYNTGDMCAVITHPHPLYGGDMHNSIVSAMCKAYGEMSYTTLRFNFRGVGESNGTFSNGIGEQEDVISALEYLKGLGKRSFDLAGYSFGAWVNVLALKQIDYVKRLIMVSPPIDFLDFSSIGFNPKIELVISGTLDEYVTIDNIKEKIQLWNPNGDLKIIEGADHFYFGQTDEIISILLEFLNTE